MVIERYNKREARLHDVYKKQMDMKYMVECIVEVVSESEPTLSLASFSNWYTDPWTGRTKLNREMKRASPPLINTHTH